MKKIVKRFKRKQHIVGIPTVKQLKTYAEQEGFQVLSYMEGREILAENNMEAETQNCPACIIRIKNDSQTENYFLFYDSTLHEKDLLFALSHECGHIYLKHPFCKKQNPFDTPSNREMQANRFAVHLTEPFPLGKFLSVLFIGFLLGVSSILLPLYITHSAKFRHQSQPAEQQIESIQPLHFPNTPNSKSEHSPLSSPQKNLEQTETENTNSVPNQTPAAPPSSDVSIPNQSNASAPEAETQNILPAETQKILPAQNAEEVVITKTGKKYHKPTCGHIKNRTGLKTIPLNEAIQQDYSPCSDCFK